MINSEYYDKQEVRAIRRLNKDYIEGIKDINDYKEVLKNINKLYIEYRKFPQEYQNNHIFAYKYFSINRDERNYKKIPVAILKDKFFINSSIDCNPDLYFYIDKELKKEFKGRVLKKSDFMKYYDKEDFEQIQNGNVTEGVIKNNFLYIKEEYIKKYDLIDKYKLKPEEYYKIKKELGGIVNEDINQQLKFLNRDRNLISIIDFNDKNMKDDNFKYCIKNIISADTSLIIYIPEEWKKDLEMIEQIIIQVGYKEHHGLMNYKNNYSYNQANIFNNINFEEYINKKYQILNNKNKIYYEYKDYNSNIKMNKIILENLFKSSVVKNNNSIDKEIIKEIPDEILRKILEEEYNKNQDKSFNNLGEKLTNIIQKYLFEKELKSDIGEKKTIKSTIKI